jgi:hypothetical protein
MRDSKFWRFAAVLLIAALLYVGHGLHSGDGLPSLTNVAHAGGVGISTLQGSVIYTSNGDGTILHMWNTEPSGKPRYVTTAMVKPQK